MIRGISLRLAFGLIMLGSFAAFSLVASQKSKRSDAFLEHWKTLKSDFQIKVVIENADEDQPWVVDKKTTYLISREDLSKDSHGYELFYFLDDVMNHHIKQLSLPYKFSQTYRATSEGTHKVNFVLRDNHGKCSIKTLFIQVKHTPEL